MSLPSEERSIPDLRAELESIKAKFGFKEPDRGNLDDPSITWREGKPDYTRANYEFLTGKTQNHAAGSLEEIVENLVKTWEMEASHKVDHSQWTTINHDDYTVQTNGGKILEGTWAKTEGNYNALMVESPTYQSYGKPSFEESHDLFRETFKSGFPWEVLKVLAGPPHVVFTWRHWGKFTGHYRGNKGNGQTLEMYGLCRVTVNDELKIEKIEAFFDPDTFLQALEGKEGTMEKLGGGQAIIGSNTGCPLMKRADGKN